ncbi:MAG: hypothetical protein ABSE49_28470 [Polyangiaceae bacterium]
MPARAIAVFLVGCLLALAVACGGPPPRPPPDPYAEAHWQDVFESTPEALFVVRARAARDDRVYGPLLRTVLTLVRDESKAAGATRALDAMADADELVVGLRPDGAAGPGERVLVARGVRADLDPAKLVDTDGHPLWAPGPPGRVRELVLEPEGASLFELPGRTWVMAQGDARARAREAFAHPMNRPPPQLDPEALALLRIDGPALVARVRVLQDLGALAAIGHHLRSVTFTLSPGAEHAVRATLAYAGDDDAALAEVATSELCRRSARAGNEPPWLPLLGSATVTHASRAVVLSAPLPVGLIEQLLRGPSAPPDALLPPP